jgi:glycosyltransferase involved in cell wall biosynthesis
LKAASYAAKQAAVAIRLIGPRTEDVAAIAGNCVDSHVEIVPWIKEKERLARTMRESHAFVLPRKCNRVNESAFPTKFGHFCSIGRPIISTSVGEVAAIVDKEKCGLTCEPTVQSLAEAMIEMARTETEERICMATNARKVAENYLDSVLIAKKYLAFLNTLVA